MNKGVFISGGTRGLGKCLAREFLGRGQSVFVAGTKPESVTAALAELSEAGGIVAGGWGDVGSFEDLRRLGAEAKAALGRIDIWINNAGVNQEPGRIWELSAPEIEAVVRTDLTGALYGAKAAFEALEAEGGWIWFLEGHGSDGRIISGLSVYGTAKRGVGYLWRALAREARGSGVKVGGLSPGIMATDFVLQNRRKEGEESWKRSAALLDILIDRPETVAAFLAPRILAAERNGTYLRWLTGAKAFARFAASPFRKRGVIEA